MSVHMEGGEAIHLLELRQPAVNPCHDPQESCEPGTLTRMAEE